MGRIRPIGSLLALVLGVAAAAPPCALACSCPEAPSLREAVNSPGAVVASGRVGPAVGEGFPFAVERWFFGPDPTRSFVARSGNGADCGLPLQPGDALIAVWHRDGAGAYSASICSRFGRLGEPEGEELLAEAQELFGSGVQVEPVDPGPGSPPVAPLPVGPEVIVVAVLGAGVAVLAAALVVAGRTRRPRPDA